MKKIAFTLIELLVVISLILITIVFGVPAFNKYGNRSELDNTAQQIQSTLEKAYSNSVTPPKSSLATANEIHLWFMRDSNSKQQVFVRPYYQIKVVPGSVTLQQTDDPTNSNSSFSAEIVSIPDYMNLSYATEGNGDQIYCNFVVAGAVSCYNQNSSTPNTPLGNSFDMILSSEKTDLKYRITISKDPFKVRLNAEE